MPVFTTTRRLVVSLLLFAPVLALAANLYSSTAPVNSQSDEDRNAALRVALGQLVVKLSGDPAALSRPDVARALTRADRYMQSFSYQPNPAAGDPAKTPKFLLVAQFDGSSVDALLREANPVAAVPDAAAGAKPQPDASPVEVPAGTGGSYRLWFSGLRSAEDYARLIGALNSSEQVRSLHVEVARGNGVQLNVDTRGTAQSFYDALVAAHIAHVTNTKPPIEGLDALLDVDP